MTASSLTRVVSGIGPKVKQLRTDSRLSMQAAAAEADVSPATIHKIEQGEMVPTITTLLKIANAFDRPISYFVEDDEPDPAAAATTHPNERQQIYTAHRGITLEGISGPYGQFKIASTVATVIPGASSGTKPMLHPGEELVYMLNGQLEFTVGDETFLLSIGDSLHFLADNPHSWRNPGDQVALAVWTALRPL